jgi:uncharacterized protein (TIGR02611 family)
VSEDAQAEPQQEKPSLLDRLEDKRAEHINKGIFYRITFAVAGMIILLAGLAMLVLPGPALVVIPIGLFMLALEFAWAEKMLELALERADIAKNKVTETTKAQRIFGIAAMVLGGIGFAIAAFTWDIPILPV